MKTRVFRAIAEDVIPDPRDAIIIGLVNACDAFRFLLPTEEYEGAKERIELLSTMDLVTRTIAAAVAESSIRLSSRAAAMTKPIPRVKLLRMIAKQSFRQGSLARLVAELHEEYGSVFTIRPPFVNRGLTVLAGADANTWMNRKGRFHLRTKDLLSDWEKVYGASRTLPGMDGAEHYRLRRAQHRGYYRAALEERLDELFDTARAGLRQWKIGDILPGASSCKGLMGSQISQLAVGVDTSDYILDLVSYKERSLVTHVQRSLPKFKPKTPGMRKKRKKILERAGGSGCAVRQRRSGTRGHHDVIRGRHAPADHGVASSLSDHPDHDAARDEHLRDGRVRDPCRHPRDPGKDGSALRRHIDRYLPERGEHRKPGVYAPFGLGTHTCLGSRWVELQMVVNLLLIAHHFTIDLHPTDYRIGYNPFPTSSPNKKLRFEIKPIRHPLERVGDARVPEPAGAAAERE